MFKATVGRSLGRHTGQSWVLAKEIFGRISDSPMIPLKHVLYMSVPATTLLQHFHIPFRCIGTNTFWRPHPAHTVRLRYIFPVQSKSHLFAKVRSNLHISWSLFEREVCGIFWRFMMPNFRGFFWVQHYSLSVEKPKSNFKNRKTYIYIYIYIMNAHLNRNPLQWSYMSL